MPGMGRNEGSSSDVQEDSLRLQQLRPHPHRTWPLEAGVAFEDRAVRGLLEPLLDSPARVADDRIFPRLDSSFRRGPCRRCSRPDSELRCATKAARALATRAFVGMHPVFTQVPPKLFRSMTATRMPAFARRTTSEGPAWPVPMTIASKDWLAAAIAYGTSGRAIDAWPRA